jgi:type IV secretory pathway TraG/TraD family ATPase VirD4
MLYGPRQYVVPVVVAVSLTVMLYVAYQHVDWEARRKTPELEPVVDRRWDHANALACQDDPWVAMQEDRAANHREQLHIGVDITGPVNTRPQSNCLILGPPRAGKTTSGLVPQSLTALGPAVLVTSKHATLYGPTAQTRARMGDLWHYNPSGEGPTLKGTKELRWSPLVGAQDWAIARRTGQAINDTLGVVAQESSNGEFFRKTAGHVVAVVVHGAALANRDMDFVLDVMSNDPPAWHELQRSILGSGNNHARRWLKGIQNTDSRTRDNIMITAQLCFDAYSFDEAVSSTVDPNFDPHLFAASEADTIYVTCSPTEQETVGALIVGGVSRAV